MLIGVVLGVNLGVVRSSKDNMKAFSDLGDNYLLGRIAREEAMQWNTDESQLHEKFSPAENAPPGPESPTKI